MRVVTLAGVVLLAAALEAQSPQQSFRAGGRIYGHVLDPRTGRPARGRLAAVVAPRAIESEAWTKAVLVNGRDWSARHTPPGWRAFLCDDGGPASCGWVQ